MKKWIFRGLLFVSILIMITGVVLSSLAPKYMGLTRSLIYRNAKILSFLSVIKYRFFIVIIFILECFSILKLHNKKIPLFLVQGINLLLIILSYNNLNNTKFLGLPVFFVGLLIFNLYYLLSLLNYNVLSND